MKYTLLLLILLSISLRISAQDSLRILQYNLLNYGNYSTFCNNVNNNHITKEGHLRTIIGYVKPDIFTVNELSSVNAYHDRLLTEVMNSDGRSYYKRTPATNIAGSDIINMMFYDSTKLVLHSMHVIQLNVRDINLYRLYYKSNKLQTGDTIFLNCIVAHLKAGDSNSDAQLRAVMAGNVMNWLQSNVAPGNYLLMGDFNVYTSAEPSYQHFTGSTAGAFQFFDPVNAPGEWNNNIDFAAYHTQSVTSSGGCQAGGGMDDRFDFILATDEIMEGSMKVRYKQGSYKAVGQDGNHFNQSITNLPNVTVPQEVLNALGRASDHLPVTMVLEVEAEQPGAITESLLVKDPVLIRISKSEAIINLTAMKPNMVIVSILSSTGQQLQQYNYQLLQGFNSINIPLRSLTSGMYLISILDMHGYRKTLKFVK